MRIWLLPQARYNWFHNLRQVKCMACTKVQSIDTSYHACPLQIPHVHSMEALFAYCFHQHGHWRDGWLPSWGFGLSQVFPMTCQLIKGYACPFSSKFSRSLSLLISYNMYENFHLFELKQLSAKQNHQRCMPFMFWMVHRIMWCKFFTSPNSWQHAMIIPMVHNHPCRKTPCLKLHVQTPKFTVDGKKSACLSFN